MSKPFSKAQDKYRLTQDEKNANDKQWYKEKADLYDKMSNSNGSLFSSDEISNVQRKQVNYDLFNNIIDLKDLEHVCKPYGTVGSLPAKFANRDIVSAKIKVLLGLEMAMPFAWKVVAINPEATTRKEQKETELIKQFVVNQIMQPIKEQAEQEAMMQMKGKELTPQDKQRIQEQIAQETEAKTPDEVRKYMLREHQDPAEALNSQILEYLLVTQKVKDKFNKGWKHANLSAGEFYYIGIHNDEPVLWVVNSLRFEHDDSPDLDFVQDGEWATCEYPMTASQVLSLFSDELTSDEIDRIYEHDSNPGLIDSNFNFADNTYNSINTIRVKHIQFKAPRKIGFLTYIGRSGKEEMMIVDEYYKLNKKMGDIKIDWDWIPEAHEIWKIMDDIYVEARPVPGQIKDLDNLHKCELSYYGGNYDNLNSVPTSPMDRMKYFQYLYDIIIYRIELLMASDKGKKFMMNINSIPKTQGLDIPKFLYFLEANSIGFMNPNEEGNRGGDVTNMVKEVDMSLTSDIEKYMKWADYIDIKCGTSIGVTKAMEAQISSQDAVSNTRQNITQSSHIIRPYFEMHNSIKETVLQALINKAKLAYSQSENKVLSYVLDDMSLKMLKIDPDLLAKSSVTLFVANAGKAQRAKEAVEQLSQAAMQNQQMDIVDVIRVIKADSLIEAEEQLEESMQRKQREAQQAGEAKIKAEKEQNELDQEFTREEWAHDKDMLQTKIREEGKIEIKKQAMLSMGFDPNKDEDDDGVPDVLEVAKFGVDADIKRQKLTIDQGKLDLDRDKLDQKTQHDKDKLKIEAKKANRPTSK